MFCVIFHIPFVSYKFDSQNKSKGGKKQSIEFFLFKRPILDVLKPIIPYQVNKIKENAHWTV